MRYMIAPFRHLLTRTTRAGFVPDEGYALLVLLPDWNAS
jgi:hypothetical protein